MALFTMLLKILQVLIFADFKQLIGLRSINKCKVNSSITGMQCHWFLAKMSFLPLLDLLLEERMAKEISGISNNENLQSAR